MSLWMQTWSASLKQQGTLFVEYYVNYAISQ